MSNFLKPSPKRYRFSVKRKFILHLLASTFLLFFAPGWRPSTAHAEAGSPYDLIAAVNALRIANGLPALQVNDSLMSAAQSHSDFQAQIGTGTHTGSGGSSSKGRALAAGYGGGANVGVTENIATGMNMSAQQAVTIWQGDSLHLSTMLGSQYQEVGAGVAMNGDTVFYTLDVGYVSGGQASSSGTSGNTASGNVQTGASSGPTATRGIMPVSTVTPGPDGNVIHTVAQGQTLWTIAASYNIALKDLLNLNNMTEKSFIHPGDKLIIRAGLPTATPTALPENTQPPAADTETPTITPGVSTVAAEALADLIKTATAAPTLQTKNIAPSAIIPSGTDPVLIVIIGMIAAGLGLIVLGFATRRRS